MNFAAQSGVDFIVEEGAVPVKDAVLGRAEMLGYDVYQVANEGKMVCVVPAEQAEAALAAMRANKYGADAAIIGEVVETPEERDLAFQFALGLVPCASWTCL